VFGFSIGLCVGWVGLAWLGFGLDLIEVWIGLGRGEVRQYETVKQGTS
jgi:hypothetical protein